MNQSDPNIPIDPKDIQSAEDIEALKVQMIEMQMEIDILKETISCCFNLKPEVLNTT